MKVILIIISLFSIQSLALTVPEAESLAIARSALLKSEDMVLKSLGQESIVKSLWSNPQLMSQVGQIESAGQRSSTLELSLTQAIPITSKYSLKSKIAELAITSQKTKLEYFTTWVKHQVKLAMWRVYITNELHQHGQERSRRFALIKKSLEAKAKVSIKQRVEKNVITSQLMLLEKEQDIKKHNLFVALNDLEFWTGRKVKPTEVILQIPSPASMFKEEAVVAQAIPDLTSNLDFKTTLDSIKASELDLRLKKNERVPDLIFGGGYRQENSNPANTFTYGIIGLNIPIWDTGVSRIQLAKTKLEIQKNSLDVLKEKLKLQYQNQIEVVNMSLHQVQRFPKSLLIKNEKAIQEAEKGFKQSVLDVSLFIQAETQSHEMIDQVYVAWMEYIENLSALLLLNNKDLNWKD